VLINNHTAVWGSYWRDGAWGYACCHQFVKNSYCIGDAGSKAADEQTAQVQRSEARISAVALGLAVGSYWPLAFTITIATSCLPLLLDCRNLVPAACY
jgi:hypothetical protein